MTSSASTAQMQKADNSNDETQLVPFYVHMTVQFYFYPSIFLQLNLGKTFFYLVISDYRNVPSVKTLFKTSFPKDMVFFLGKSNSLLSLCPFLKVSLILGF